MNETHPFTLDTDQQRVATAPPKERLWVVAGPGSGKTETVSARIAYLLEEEGLAGNEVLVISFSRAAVEAVQRRQRRNGARSWVSVMTLDALAARVLSDHGQEIEGLGFDARIRRLGELLGQEEIRDPLPDVRHMIIDEVQDIVGERATLVSELLRKLPLDVGFTMFGDPKQGIYDFQLRDAHDDPLQILETVRGLSATEVGLWKQYRAETMDAEKAMSLRGSGSTDIVWTGEMKAYLSDLPVFDVDGLVDQVRRLKGTVAVLTQTNAQALLVARRLHERGVVADLLARSTDRPLDPWLAKMMADGPASLDQDRFIELADGSLPEPSEAWALLRRLTSARTKFLDVARVSARLALGAAPTGLTRPQHRVTVSTIHRAKGLEFDDVLLLHPDGWYGDNDSSRARSLYVAITRPRRRTYPFRLEGAMTFGWKTDDRTERVWRSGRQGKGTSGFEIRGSDWRGFRPPGGDEGSAELQEMFRCLADESAPESVDIQLDSYGSTLSRPRFVARLEGRVIGELSDRFLESFVRRVGRPKDWPRTMTDAYFVGVETVAGPPQQTTVGRNGLWLSPLIVGAANLKWSHS